jgi:hypothetical protein
MTFFWQDVTPASPSGQTGARIPVKVALWCPPKSHHWEERL